MADVTESALAQTTSETSKRGTCFALLGKTEEEERQLRTTVQSSLQVRAILHRSIT